MWQLEKEKVRPKRFFLIFKDLKDFLTQKEKSFGWTFSFSNCHIKGLDNGSLVLFVFGQSLEILWQHSTSSKVPIFRSKDWTNNTFQKKPPGAPQTRIQYKWKRRLLPISYKCF
jgi:hypothetical protein